MEDLEDGAVHLWLASTRAWRSPEAGAEAFAGLGPVERARWECRRSPEERHLFAVSHWLVRQTLSRYDGRPLRGWRFLVGELGKPRIDPASGPSPLTFSLAHTRGMAVCAVAQGMEVGVDVERKDRAVDALRLARRFFAPSEVEDLMSLPPEGMRERFFLHWTLKEATLKALGIGLARSLDQIAFTIAAGTPARIRPLGSQGQGKGWRWAAIGLASPYLAALALQGGPDGAVLLRTYEALPGGRVAPFRGQPLALAGMACSGKNG